MMQACPRCNQENSDISVHCERCGAMLSNPQTFVHTQGVYETIPVTSDEMYGSIPPPPPSTAFETTPAYTLPAEFPQAEFLNRQQRDPRSSTDGIFRLILKGILYIIGLFIAAFGLFGTTLSFGGDSVADVALLFSLLLVIIGIVVFILILRHHKTPRLRWWQRLLCLIGLTVAALIFSFGQYMTIGISDQNPLSNYFFGITVCIYGVGLAAFALW